MNILKYASAGLAGSTALTGVHQMLKNTSKAPRVDLLGQQALEKMLGSAKNKYSQATLYNSTLAADLVSNGLFYGIIAKAKNSVLTGFLLGTSYGIGTLFLPKVLGLKEDYVNSSKEKMYMTVGYYAFGGLIAGLVAKLFQTKEKK